MKVTTPVAILLVASALALYQAIYIATSTFVYPDGFGCGSAINPVQLAGDLACPGVIANRRIQAGLVLLLALGLFGATALVGRKAQADQG